MVYINLLLVNLVYTCEIDVKLIITSFWQIDIFLLISCPAELEHFPSQRKKNPNIIKTMATGSLNEKKGYYEDKRMVARSDGL